MSIIIQGGQIYADGAFREQASMTLCAGGDAVADAENEATRVIELGNSFILPSLCDVHVHFREPGQAYKESIASGSRAALQGGYTTVCTMPNVTPPPADRESLAEQCRIIERDACISVIPYGTITREQSGRGTLSDMEAMAPYVAAFSDDGCGVQDDGLMREAMQRAKALGKLIVAHCEDEALLREGRVRESEWRQIERDLRLADETGAAYHVCHISCRESAALIREAKQSGVDVSCETAPHYLLLDRSDAERGIREVPAQGGRYKMNPPIKEPADREALVEGLADGTIDMVATDHAPHSAEEKSRGFQESLNGITGLECAFPVLYTGLVRTGRIALETLVERMAVAPRRRFGLPDNGWIIVDPETAFRIDARRFASQGKCTPFDGWMVYGKIRMTILGEDIRYASA